MNPRKNSISIPFEAPVIRPDGYEQGILALVTNHPSLTFGVEVPEVFTHCAIVCTQRKQLQTLHGLILPSLVLIFNTLCNLFEGLPAIVHVS